jgi:hypothetical protein
MRIRTITLKDKIAAWEILQANAKTELADVAYAAADLAELDRLIEASKDLEVQRGFHLESLSAGSRQRQELTQAGDATYQRLSLTLRAKLGPKSEKLHRFGVAPKRTARRKPQAANPSEPQTPTPGAGAVEKTAP